MRVLNIHACGGTRKICQITEVWEGISDPHLQGSNLAGESVPHAIQLHFAGRLVPREESILHVDRQQSLLPPAAVIQCDSLISPRAVGNRSTRQTRYAGISGKTITRRMACQGQLPRLAIAFHPTNFYELV